MFNKIKEFFTGKPAEAVAEVPYKVEVVAAEVVAEVAPVVAKKPVAKKPIAKKPVAKKPRTPRQPK